MKKSKRVGRIDARKVACVSCGAAKGEFCHSVIRRSTGKWRYRVSVHIERLRDYEESGGS